MQKSRMLNFGIAFLLIFTLSMVGCVQKQEQEAPADIAAVDDSVLITAKDKAATELEKRQEIVEQELESLMQKVELAKKELAAKEEELSQRENVMAEREVAASAHELKLQQYRTISCTMLAVGGIALLVGLLMIYISRKKAAKNSAKKAPKEAPKAEVKKEKK